MSVGAFVVLILTALLSWAGAAVARRYAVQRGILDQPGERRSHSGAVPRGGGLGIPVALLFTVIYATLEGYLSVDTGMGMAGGLLAVAMVGWLDDQMSLPVAVRLGVQTAAAGWLVWWTGGLESIELGTEIPLGAAGHVLAVLGCVWLVNLYNFMDGIDAFAASEGVFAGVVMGGWFLLSGQSGLALSAFGIAVACAGFLPWNLPPARLFLGDVGSTSLGFAFAALALRGEQTESLPAMISVIILGVFVFDATFTVASRILKRARWYTPHREHAYQYLVRAGLGHGQAVCRLTAVNLLVILPVVLVSYRWPALSAPALAVCSVLALALWRETRRRCVASETFS